jgi:alpha-L-arabinofuranosidase
MHWLASRFFRLAACRDSALLYGVSVSTNSGKHLGPRCMDRGVIIGLLFLVASMTAADAPPVSPSDVAEPAPEHVVADPTRVDPVGQDPLRGRLDLGHQSGTINPFLYGQSLASLGRGLDAGLWAELIEDRKFFRPPTAPGSPWERFGGEIGWSLTYDVERTYAGVGTVKVTVSHRAQEALHGIGQGGLPLVADQEYVGHLILAGRGMVKVILEWGERVGDRDVIGIRLSQEGFGRYPIRFRPRTASNDGRLSVGLESTGSIWIGGVSLMPADHQDGLRADTIALLNQLGTPVYRWPSEGATGYDWRDGIGPRERRPPRHQPSAARVESNDFGIDEFLAFCRKLGAEPLVVVDTGIGSPELAAALVQYCNGSDRTTWGRRRALNGHAAPYNVRWWAVGGGLPGDGQVDDLPLEQRLIRHREFALAMRAIDDQIQLVAYGQTGAWNGRILAECGDTMAVLSRRIAPLEDQDPQQLAADPAFVLRGVVEDHREIIEQTATLLGRPVPIALEGWNLDLGSGQTEEASSILPEPWRHALAITSRLHEMTRHPDLVQMAYFAPTPAQVLGTVQPSMTTARLTPAAVPLALYRQRYGSESLRVEGDLAPLDVVAALTADRSLVTIGIVNPAHQPATLAFDLTGASIATRATCHRIKFVAPAGDQPSDIRAHPAIEETVIDDFDPESIEIPPLSVTVYQVPLSR